MELSSCYAQRMLPVQSCSQLAGQIGDLERFLKKEPSLVHRSAS